MVTADEIRDSVSLRAWLRSRDREVALWMAYRAAARVVPLAWASHDIQRRDTRTLYVLRCVHLAMMAAHGPDEDLQEPARQSVELINAVVSAGAHISVKRATPESAALGAVPSAEYSVRSVYSTDFVVTAEASPLEAVAAFEELGLDCELLWAEFIRDAAEVEAGGNPTPSRLWSAENPLAGIWARVGSAWLSDAKNWPFWFQWYEGLLAGHPIDWTLQEKVALIPDEIWQQGPGAVAAAIARIEEQMRLHREVVQLKARLVLARTEIADLPRRGHNNPPELLDPVAEVERQAGAVAALNEAEAELAKDMPRPAVLRTVGRVLLTAASSAMSYCASLGDVAAKKAAAAVGMAGGAALVAKWAGLWEAVESLAKALLEYAKSFGGG